MERAIPPLTDEETALWRGFLAWSDDVRADVERAVTTATGLSMAEFVVLIRLDDGGTPQRDLQEGLRWSATRLSHQLARMEERGWIARRSSGSGRAVDVAITASGAAVLAAAMEPHAAAVRSAFLAPMTGAQRAVLRSMLGG